MAENEIIERICGSCGCDEATAKEYEISCSGLGIESECMEYFTMVLTY